MKTQVAVTVRDFVNGEVDKNGKSPVLLYVLGGKCPNRNVLSGTFAENEGFEIGKSYLVQVTEREEDPTYGRQFQFTKIGELNTLDLIGIADKLGEPTMIDVTVKAEISAPADIKAKTTSDDVL